MQGYHRISYFESKHWLAISHILQSSIHATANIGFTKYEPVSCQCRGAVTPSACWYQSEVHESTLLGRPCCSSSVPRQQSSVLEVARASTLPHCSAPAINITRHSLTYLFTPFIVFSVWRLCIRNACSQWLKWKYKCLGTVSLYGSLHWVARPPYLLLDLRPHNNAKSDCCKISNHLTYLHLHFYITSVQMSVRFIVGTLTGGIYGPSNMHSCWHKPSLGNTALQNLPVWEWHAFSPTLTPTCDTAWWTQYKHL